MTTASVIALSPEDHAEIVHWLDTYRDELPGSVRWALQVIDKLVNALHGGARDLTRLLNTLRREMGIDPKSERHQPSGETSAENEQSSNRSRTKDPVAELIEKQKLLKVRRDWHRSKINKRNRELVSIENQIEQLKREAGEALPQLTSEQEAEQLDRESEELRQRFELGDAIDPSLKTSQEALMTGNTVALSERTECLSIEPERLTGTKTLHQGSQPRIRHDISLSVQRVVLEVEKRIIVTPEGERKTVHASTRNVGPPRYSVTWNFLVSLTVMTSLYAMPMHRFARMATTDERRFTSSGLCKMFKYVAKRLVPIYVQLFDELAESKIMMGDDTHTRVLDVNRHFKTNTSHDGAYWNDWPERGQRKPTGEDGDGLGQMLARELGFRSRYRNGSKGHKRAFHTTVLAGRSVPDDAESFIVFYRSHFGGLGDLLEAALERRTPAKKDLVVQSDLSTVNLIADPDLRERFEIQVAGCLSHARRPFARYKYEDPELCEIALDYFAGLAYLEEDLDEHGRNRQNVTAIRTIDGQESWDAIERVAKIVQTKWSGSSKLGEAANYILRNKKELQLYLNDPRLAPDNNLSERLLRMERIIQNNSMFRVSLEGRYCLDITRTIAQTATASNVPVAEYLEAILRTPQQDIDKHPERFTPYAWSKRMAIDIGSKGDALN